MQQFSIPLQQGNDIVILLSALCWVIVIGFAYFIPSLIAILRKHPNVMAIFVLNLLLGWTVLGWIGSLVWSFTSTNR